jgi:hypothetical protein
MWSLGVVIEADKGNEVGSPRGYRLLAAVDGYLKSHWPDDNILPKRGSNDRTTLSPDSKGS